MVQVTVTAPVKEIATLQDQIIHPLQKKKAPHNPKLLGLSLKDMINTSERDLEVKELMVLSAINPQKVKLLLLSLSHWWISQ